MKTNLEIIRSSRRLLGVGASVSLLSLAFALPAFGASGSWNVDAGTSWTTLASWAGSTVAGGSPGDVANFNYVITAARTVTLDGDRILGTLNVSPNVAAATSTYTLAGNGTGGYFIFDNGGSGAGINFLSASATPGANLIYAPIILKDNLEISSQVAGSQTIKGTITGGYALTVDSNGTHPAGTTSTVGDIVLSGVNSFTGGLTVTEARVQATNSWAMGTGNVTVTNGGQVFLSNGGFIDNNMTLIGLGWNEGTGRLGALRVENNAVINGNINVDNSLGLVPAVRFHGHSSGTVTARFDGVISGNANVEFTKGNTAGTTTWILNNNNTYAGTTTIGLNAGSGTAASVLQIGNNNTSGSLNAASVITINAGGVLAFNRRDNVVFNNTIAAGAGGLTHSGVGNVLISTPATGYTGLTTANGTGWLGGSTLTFGTGGAFAFGGTALTMANYADIEFNTSSNIALSGAVAGNRGSYLLLNGTGTTTMSGANDNGGARAMVNNGTLVLGKASTAAIHSLGGGGDVGLIVNGGVVQLAGTGGDQIADTTMVRTTAGLIDLNGTTEIIGALSGAGATVTNTNATASTLTVNGTTNLLGTFFNGTTGASNLFAPSFGGTIQNGLGVVSLTKAGTGIQFLNGAQLFTGATTISGGTLVVNGSLPAAGAVNITGGNLAGVGSVGSVILAAGTTIRPGPTGYDNDAPGANITLAGLTATGGDMRVNFGIPGINDTVTVTGGALFVGATTLTPQFTALPTAGNYTYLTSGALTPTIVPTATVPATTRNTFTVVPVGNTLQLQVGVGVGNALPLTWNGGTGTWDLNTTPNFFDGIGANTFYNLDSVTFVNASTGTITMAAGTYTPTGITDTTTLGNDVTLTGTGVIAGAAGITKTGTSTLTVSTANTFTGDVVVTSGVLKAGSATALGAIDGQTYISGGGTLDVNGQTLGYEIVNIAGVGAGGNGALVNTGAAQQNALRIVRLTDNASVGGTNRFDIRNSAGGELLDLAGFTLTKVGANDFHLVGTSVTNGNIVVNQGTFAIETTSIMQGTGTITYNAGAIAAFYQNTTGNVTRPMFMNSSIVENYGQSHTINSLVTATGTITLQGTGGTHTFGDDWVEGLPGSGITKIGASSYILARNVNYTGATTVQQGTLQLGSGGYTTLPNTSAINVSGGGALTLNINGNYTLTAPITYGLNNMGGGAINWTGVEQDSTLNIATALGNSTKWGTFTINSGVVNLSAANPTNIMNFRVLNNPSNGAGTNMGILNITGGNHRFGQLYTGDASNTSGIINMSGGTVTIDTNGATTTAANNNSGYALAGGFRIGHWNNGSSATSIFNLSGGLFDASLNTVSVGWDGEGFLNMTGGTLKAWTIYVDGNGNSALPIINRMDVSGGSLVEVGFGGIQSYGNSAINSGEATWRATNPSDWTRGISLNATGAASTTFDTGIYRVNQTGVLAGAGNLNVVGTGILNLGAANLNTGSVIVNSGVVRMSNAQALGDSFLFSMAAGTTFDVNGNNGSGAGFKPTTITFGGGTGTAGNYGGIINSSGTTAGIGVDPGGTINILSDTTVYLVGRTEFGTGGGVPANNPLILAGTSDFVKNGQGPMIWRGTTASTAGDFVINGGHLYAEEQDNNLGAGGTVTVNKGGALSAWQTDGTTSQDKAIVLNGGALMTDVTSTWTGGVTLTADSWFIRNSGNAAVTVLDSPTLNLNGYTWTVRDPMGTGSLTFRNNSTGSGGGKIDIIAGVVNIGASSLIDSAVKVRTNGTLAFIDSTGAFTGNLELAGGKVTESTGYGRTFTGGINVTSYGYLGSLTAGGSFTTGAITLAPNAGLTFGSGVGYTALATPGTTMGDVMPAGITGGFAAFNPNLTVSSNTNATANNDTVFATWDGTKYTGLAPTIGTIAGAVTNDNVLVTAAEAVALNQTIGTLVTEQTVTINAGVTLKIGQGGIVLREALAAGFAGAGSLTTGRADGLLAINGANHFDTVAAYQLGAAIIDNPLATGAFTPVKVVTNGPSNFTTVNSTFTGGMLVNAGRIRLNTVNGLGLGSVTVRDGGTIMAISDSTSFAIHNNLNLAGLGMNEAAGTMGSLRLAGTSARAPVATAGTISLDAAGTRIMTNGSQYGAILGNIVGSAPIEKTGAGTLSVYSALDWSGALTLGAPGANLNNGTYTAFSIADGGVASSLGASSSAASNLVIQSGTLNYIGGGASTDRLFSITPTLATAGNSIGIANNGFGNLNLTNTGAVAMNNGSTDVTITLTANNFTNNTFTPTLADPSGSRLNLTVSGNTGTWTLNGSSYQFGGTVRAENGADLILDTPTDMTINLFTTSGTGSSYLIKENSNTLTFGGTGLLAETDNSSGALIMNAGTVIFDKRGTGSRVLGSNGTTGQAGLQVNGGLIKYASTASPDQIYNQVDVVMTGGTIDLNGKWEEIDGLSGTGGVITNTAAGTTSRFQTGSLNGQMPWNYEARTNFGGSFVDGAGTLEFVKSGAGVLVLSGNNTAWTGRTYVWGGGFLSIDDEARLGANPAAFVENQLQLVGTSGIESTATFAIDDSNRGIWLGNDVAAFRPASGTTLTLGGTINGAGGIEAVGAGGLTLAGIDNYYGATSVWRGTLTLDYTSQDNSKLSDTNVLYLRGGNLVLNGGTHSEYVGSTTIDGSGLNAGSTNLSRTPGTLAVLNLNGITRNVAGTVDFGEAGLATTDTANSNGILAGANAAYATLAKTDWAISSTGGGDSPITAFTAYSTDSYAATTNHVNVTTDVAFAAATTVSTLRFNTGTVDLSLDGQILRLNQQGILITPNSTGATISGATGTITGFTPTASVTTDLIVHQHSASPATISAVIANNVSGSFTNTVGLTKAGAGTLVLTAANTFTGLTQINEGTLELGGTAGTVGANTAANSIWIDGTLKLNRTDASPYTINNNMGGSGGGLIQKVGTNTAILSGGIGTYSGGVLVSQGTLVFSGDALANANATNDMRATSSVYGTVSIGDASSVGSGDIAFLGGRGANHTMRKDIVVNDIVGWTGKAIIGMGTGTGAVGAFNLIHQGDVVMNHATILRGDTADRLTFSGVLSGNVGTLTIDSSAYITAVSAGSNNGRVTMENDNTFVGDVVVSGAVLQIGSGVINDPRNQIPDASNVTLTGTSAKRAVLQLNGDGETINDFNGNAYSNLRSVAAGSSQMWFTVLGSGTFDGKYDGDSNGTMFLEKAGSGTLTLGGTEDNNGGRILVSGGTLVLAKASSGSAHAAAITINITGGTLKLGGTGGDQIYDSTTMTMYGGTFDLGGTNEGIENLFGDTGTVLNSTGASTLTLGTGGAANENGSSRFGGTITDGAGTLALTKVNAGGLVLTGNNSYSGVTTINGGFIQIGDGHTTGTLGGGNVTVAAGAELVVNRSNTATIANAISGAGNVIQNGTGTTELTGASNYTGKTVVNTGTLLLGSLFNASTSEATVAGGATLGGSGALGDTVIQGIVNPGSLTDVGTLKTGDLIIGSTGTYAADIKSTTGSANLDKIIASGNLSILLGAQLALTEVGANDTLGSTKLVLVDYTGYTWDTGIFTGHADDSTFVLGANTWKIDYNDTTDGVTPGNYVTLTTVISTPYAVWAAGFGLGPTSQNNDDDLDGVKNLAEFALDGNPLLAGNLGKRFARIIDLASDSDGPTLTFIIPVRVGTGDPFTGATAKSATRDLVTYTIQGSADLAAWTTLVVTDVTSDTAAAAAIATLPALTSGTEWQYRAFRAPGDVDSPTKSFLRATFSHP